MGIRPDNELFGLVNMDGRETPLPPHGLLVSKKLAEVLRVGVGDTVQVEVLVDKRPVREVTIAATLRDFAGLQAYMDLDELHQIMLEGPVVTGVHMLVDPAYQDALYRELKETPQVASVLVKEHSIESFNNTIAQNLGDHEADQPDLRVHHRRRASSTTARGFRWPSGAASWRRCG